MLNVLIAVMVTHICTDLRAVHQKSKTNCKHTYHILIMVVVAWVYIYLSKFNGKYQKKKKKNSMDRDFHGGPVIKTLSFHCRGHRFNPGRGTKIPTCCGVGKKKKPSGLFK